MTQIDHSWKQSIANDIHTQILSSPQALTFLRDGVASWYSQFVEMRTAYDKIYEQRKAFALNLQAKVEEFDSEKQPKDHHWAEFYIPEKRTPVAAWFPDNLKLPDEPKELLPTKYDRKYTIDEQAALLAAIHDCYYPGQELLITETEELEIEDLYNGEVDPEVRKKVNAKYAFNCYWNNLLYSIRVLPKINGPYLDCEDKDDKVEGLDNNLLLGSLYRNFRNRPTREEPPVTDIELTVLVELNQAVQLINQENLSAFVNIKRDALKTILPDMEKKGLIERPSGSRKGYAITSMGKVIANKTLPEKAFISH